MFVGFLVLLLDQRSKLHVSVGRGQLTAYVYKLLKTKDILLPIGLTILELFSFGNKKTILFIGLIL